MISSGKGTNPPVEGDVIGLSMTASDDRYVKHGELYLFKIGPLNDKLIPLFPAIDFSAVEEGIRYTFSKSSQIWVPAPFVDTAEVLFHGDIRKTTR